MLLLLQTYLGSQKVTFEGSQWLGSSDIPGNFDLFQTGSDDPHLATKDK